MANRGGRTTASLPSGYVYFGQFIDHDVTKMASAESQPSDHGVAVEELVQQRNPALDLDSVYGSGFKDETIALDRSTGRFQLGSSVATTVDNGIEKVELPKFENSDLPRDKAQKARIADSRNDENLLVAQVHLLFLKLHNYIVERSKEPNPKKAFNQARTEVVWIYHDLIKFDFLPRLLNPTVYEQVVLNGEFVNKNPENDMPIEFSGAAFRFGHSMVRLAYSINELVYPTKSLTLDQLFIMTGKGGFGGLGGLPSDCIVELSLLLGDNTANHSMRIEPQVSIVIPKRENQDRVLSVRNLLRARSMRIPTAQTVLWGLDQMDKRIARDLGVSALKYEELDYKHYLTKMGKRASQTIYSETPLWYYVLAEASARENGERLGPLGSYFVATTLMELIKIRAKQNLQIRHFPMPAGEHYTLMDLDKYLNHKI